MSTINKLQTHTRLLTLFLLSSFLIFGTSACSDDDDNPTGSGSDMNIVETAKSNDNLDSLAANIEEAGLTNKLSDPNSNYTVFAPTDEAFKSFEDSLNLSSDQLKEVLKYHVLASKVKEGDLKEKQTVASLSGEDLYVTTGPDGAFVNQSSKITETDIEASNGVIHLIDEVQVPNEFLNILQIAKKNYKLTDLAGIVNNNKIFKDVLTGGDAFTVLAPTNQALEEAGDIIDGLNDAELTQVLSNHAALGKTLSEDLTDGQEIPTVYPDDNVTVDIDGEGNITLNGSVDVITADLESSKGVLHVIDGVLVPESMQ